MVVAAADNAAELHAPAEEAMNLQRACTLWDEVSPDVRRSPTEHRGHAPAGQA